MDNENKTDKYSVFLNIIVWGAMWGIFEATVGYLLHGLSFGYSWLIWYPAVCFFMANVYRKTKKVSSILFIGLLCASIKMLNLFLPGRIDKVINPAISIAFEALVAAAVVFAAKCLFKEKRKNLFTKALIALTMNTGWRILYILYLLFLVPNWIRDISVISSAEKFIPFFITQNLITTILIFTGYQFKYYIFKPVDITEHNLLKLSNIIPSRAMLFIQTGLAALILFTNIVLQLMLK